jgi:hypothetical protein
MNADNPCAVSALFPRCFRVIRERQLMFLSRRLETTPAEFAHILVICITSPLRGTDDASLVGSPIS